MLGRKRWNRLLLLRARILKRSEAKVLGVVRVRVDTLELVCVGTQMKDTFQSRMYLWAKRAYLC